MVITIEEVRYYIPEIEVENFVVQSYINIVDEADATLTTLNISDERKKVAKIFAVCHLVVNGKMKGVTSQRSFTGDSIAYDLSNAQRFYSLLSATIEGRAIINVLNGGESNAPARVHVI